MIVMVIQCKFMNAAVAVRYVTSRGVELPVFVKFCLCLESRTAKMSTDNKLLALINY